MAFGVLLVALTGPQTLDFADDLLRLRLCGSFHGFLLFERGSGKAVVGDPICRRYSSEPTSFHSLDALRDNNCCIKHAEFLSRTLIGAQVVDRQQHLLIGNVDLTESWIDIYDTPVVIKPAQSVIRSIALKGAASSSSG